MKKILISLFSIIAIILFLNTSQVQATTYTDITKYTGKDINSTNSTYVANLAREYIIANIDSCENLENLSLTNDMFNNCVIVYNSSYNNFSVNFNNSGFYKTEKSSSYVYGNSHNITLFLGNNTPVLIYSTSGRLKHENTNATPSSGYSYYTSSDIYTQDGATLTISKNLNYNYNYVSELTPALEYTVTEHELGLLIAVTPYNISYPYSMNAYYEPDFTEENPFILETNATVQQTTSFVIPADTESVLIECIYNGGELSLEINLGSTDISKPVQMSSLSINSYDTGGEYYRVNIATYLMQEGYNVYWSDKPTFSTENSLNYKLGKNTYSLDYPKVNKYIYFFITDETGQCFYIKKHDLEKNASTAISGGSSSNISFGDNTYNGFLGDVNADVDINDFSVDDGISALKGFFTNVQDVFSMIGEFISFLPNWITIPLGSLLILIVIITVIKFIRG